MEHTTMDKNTAKKSKKLATKVNPDLPFAYMIGVDGSVTARHFKDAPNAKKVVNKLIRLARQEREPGNLNKSL